MRDSPEDDPVYCMFTNSRETFNFSLCLVIEQSTVTDMTQAVLWITSDHFRPSFQVIYWEFPYNFRLLLLAGVLAGSASANAPFVRRHRLFAATTQLFPCEASGSVRLVPIQRQSGSRSAFFQLCLPFRVLSSYQSRCSPWTFSSSLQATLLLLIAVLEHVDRITKGSHDGSLLFPYGEARRAIDYDSTHCSWGS